MPVLTTPQSSFVSPEKTILPGSKKKRMIVITIDEEGKVGIKSDALFIAGEFRKIMRSLDRFYRVSRRNYRVEQNRLNNP